MQSAVVGSGGGCVVVRLKHCLVYSSGTRWKVLRKFGSLYVTHINTYTLTSNDSNRLTVLNDSTLSPQP